MRKLSSRKKVKKDNKRGNKEDIENDNDKQTEKETDSESEAQDGDKKTHTESDDDEPVVKLKKKNSKIKSVAKEKSVTKEKSVSKEIEKTAKKSEEKEDSEESSNDDTEYEVENIIDDKFQRGKKYYQVRWKGFSAKDDTWEPESTLNCDEIIKKYLESANNPSASNSNKRKNSNNISSKSTNKRKVGSKTNLQQENGGVKKKGGVKEDEVEKSEEEAKDEDEVEKANSEEDENDEDEEKDWEVERIIDVHFLKNGAKKFLIRWKGYKSSDDTWEPEENVSSPELIEKFMRKFEETKYANKKELRAERKQTNRFTLMEHPKGRRLSKRNDGRQRAVYYDAE